MVVLTLTPELVEKMAVSFRGHLQTEGFATTTSKFNPGFVNVTKAAWVLFIHAAELDETDQVGEVDVVYWPTEGGDFTRVAHTDWKKARPGNVWRPLAVRIETADGGPATAYDHLLD